MTSHGKDVIYIIAHTITDMELYSKHPDAQFWLCRFEVRPYQEGHINYPADTFYMVCATTPLPEHMCNRQHNSTGAVFMTDSDGTPSLNPIMMKMGIRFPDEPLHKLSGIDVQPMQVLEDLVAREPDVLELVDATSGNNPLDWA